MTEQEIRSLYGSFTWDFGSNFFIETAKGNFIYNSPSYGGDGIVRATNNTYDEYFQDLYGRDKGNHYISDFCGEQVEVIC